MSVKYPSKMKRSVGTTHACTYTHTHGSKLTFIEKVPVFVGVSTSPNAVGYGTYQRQHHQQNKQQQNLNKHSP